MMEMIGFFTVNIICACLVGAIASYLWDRKFGPKIVIYRSERKDFWFDPAKKEIPEDMTYFIATDGVRVKVSCGVDYDKEGRPLMYNFPGEKIPIKYWQPLPSPPKEEKCSKKNM